MFIREVRLLANSITDLKDFYNGTLGLDIISEKVDSVTFGINESTLSFDLTDKTDKPFYHLAFNIPENRLKDAKAWLSGKTDLISLNGEDEFDFKTWNANSVYFYDVAGNILELIARHDLDNSSDREFSAGDLLNISEVGLPVRDPSASYEELANEFDLKVFSGDMKTFIAAGDNNGLFIIVNEGRKWFPDCPVARIFPLEVVIETDKTGMLEIKDTPYKIITTKK